MDRTVPASVDPFNLPTLFGATRIAPIARTVKCTLDDLRQFGSVESRLPLRSWAGAELRPVVEDATKLYFSRGTCAPSCAGQTRWGVWVCCVRANGVRIADLRCCVCGYKMRDTGADKLGLEIPTMRDNHNTEPCARCGGTDGVEEHHWAPRHLFGFVEADRWPTSMLCRTCHREWHRIVTPAMSTIRHAS